MSIWKWRGKGSSFFHTPIIIFQQIAVVVVHGTSSTVQVYSMYHTVEQRRFYFSETNSFFDSVCGSADGFLSGLAIGFLLKWSPEIVYPVYMNVLLLGRPYFFIVFDLIYKFLPNVVYTVFVSTGNKWIHVEKTYAFTKFTKLINQTHEE